MASKPSNSTKNGPSSGSTTGTSSKTLELRVPKKEDRKIFVAKFSNAFTVDFSKWKQTPPEMAREITVAEEQPRTSTEETPKGPAGSEMGKERREAARQRRFVRHKRPEDAPWILTDNSTSNKKKYRGIKEGGVQDNSAYYVFTTVGGRIEAYPVSEWFTFAPVQRYKTLTSEEAEEAFQARDKILNHFNVMTKNRLRSKDEDQGEDEDDAKTGKGNGERKARLRIRDGDDDMPQEMSDSDDEEGAAKDTEAVEGKLKKHKTGKGKEKPAVKGKKKRAPVENDGEPAEESDDGDFETRELDYDEASESSSDEDDKVLEEETIKGIDEEIEEMLDEDEEGDEKDLTEKNGEEVLPEDEESGSDNEEEDFDAMADSVIPQAKRTDVTQSSSAVESQKDMKSAANNNKNGKRKQESELSEVATKRTKTMVTPTSSSVPAVSDGKLEDEVRRYLERKPLTSIELLRKLTKSGGPERTAEVKARLGDIIKRLNPEKKSFGGKLYMHLKK